MIEAKTPKQAIAGVAPPQLGEVTIMTVWPSIASTGLGRALGLLYTRNVKTAIGNVLSLRNLVMLATIPIALPLYGLLRLPFRCLRYKLTNRRVIIQQGYSAVDLSSVSLDQFDSIEVRVLPGQAWYPAGDLVFKRGQIETFRLHGIRRPETFRQTCMKARDSFVGVKKAMERQQQHAAK